MKTTGCKGNDARYGDGAQCCNDDKAMTTNDALKAISSGENNHGEYNGDMEILRPYVPLFKAALQPAQVSGDVADEIPQGEVGEAVKRMGPFLAELEVGRKKSKNAWRGFLNDYETLITAASSPVQSVTVDELERAIEHCEKQSKQPNGGIISVEYYFLQRVILAAKAKQNMQDLWIAESIGRKEAEMKRAQNSISTWAEDEFSLMFAKILWKQEYGDVPFEDAYEEWQEAFLRKTGIIFRALVAANIIKAKVTP